MRMYFKFCIPLLQLFSIGLFLQGYFQVAATLDDINRITSSNDKPMKVILILVDALRIDLFTNITFYQEMKVNQERYQILYYGVAHSPAATQLNLKAITTGNFPAFIDFGSNMAAQEINFDNIISSMKRSKKRLALLGDETWSFMFPSQFDYKFTSESFDVRDLDSDDNIVINNIFNLINDDYDLIVGHLLGIDHSGHSYNDSNSELWNKQKQYSDLLFQIYNRMDDNSILFIVGDHGMSEDGNHGGGSSKEISSTIYAINKQYEFDLEQFNSKINNRLIIQNPIMEKTQYIRQIYNIDLAPTISYLMGISIPFSNIGAVLTEMISTKESQELSCQENYHQIKEYLSKFQQFESSLNVDIENYKQSNQSCKYIQETIYNLQSGFKKNNQTYDYFNLIVSILLMITLFAFQVINICETLFNKEFIDLENFIAYRFEKYPLFMLLILFMAFQVSLAIKSFSLYILILLLKKLLVPLFSFPNINLIIKNIIHPIPYYRRYFFIIVNLVVQKGIQELSADRQIIYTANILGLFINVIIMLIIAQFRLLFRPALLTLMPIFFLMIVSEQYNVSLETTKPQSPFIIKAIAFILQSFWIKYLVPALFLQRMMFKLYHNVPFFILLTMAILVSVFNNSATFNIIMSDLLQKQIWIFSRFLPLSLFILSALFIILQKDLIFFFPIVLAISGKQGIFIYCCLIYSIIYMLKFLSKIENAWIPPIAGGICSIFLNYYWFTLGHRMSFSNVKFQDALIGSETYNVVFNTTLLIISIYGIFCSTEIIRKIIQYLWNGTYFRKCKMIEQEFENKIIEFLIAIQFSQIIFTSIHSALNLYHQNIIDLFAQKIIYESIIFTVLVLFNLLNEAIKITVQKFQRILLQQYYQPIEQVAGFKV